MGNSFLTDQEKMIDFFMMTRSNFLEFYSYLTEDDYDATCYDVLERSGYWNADAIDPSCMTGLKLCEIIDGIQKQEWLLSKKREVIEVCPHCEKENVWLRDANYDAASDNYKAVCKNCLKEIFLCDECMHADDNPGIKCDWCKADGYSRCFRGEIQED